MNRPDPRNQSWGAGQVRAHMMWAVVLPVCPEPRARASSRMTFLPAEL